jgi:formiminotetrahydrofolate cyclodeaminase
LALAVAERGNSNAVTDAGVAALLAHAAVTGAAYNVRVNVQALEDRSKGQTLLTRARQLQMQATELADQTKAFVERALST